LRHRVEPTIGTAPQPGGLLLLPRGRPPHVAWLIITVVVGPSVQRSPWRTWTKVGFDPGNKGPYVMPGFMYLDAATTPAGVMNILWPVAPGHDPLPNAIERVVPQSMGAPPPGPGNKRARHFRPEATAGLRPAFAQLIYKDEPFGAAVAHTLYCPVPGARMPRRPGDGPSAEPFTRPRGHEGPAHGKQPTWAGYGPHA